MSSPKRGHLTGRAATCRSSVLENGRRRGAFSAACLRRRRGTFYRAAACRRAASFGFQASGSNGSTSVEKIGGAG